MSSVQSFFEGLVLNLKNKPLTIVKPLVVDGEVVFREAGSLGSSMISDFFLPIQTDVGVDLLYVKDGKTAAVSIPDLL